MYMLYICFSYSEYDDFVLPEDSGFDTQDDSGLSSTRSRQSGHAGGLAPVDESFLKMMLSLMKDVPPSVKNKFQSDMFAAIYRIRGQYLLD